MIEYLRDNASQILDGLLFGLGVLAVYLGAVFTGALIRSLGGAGSKGLTFAGRYLQGWFYYLRGDDRDIINVTLNIIDDNKLKFDTIVADRRIWSVWPNAFRQAMIRRAARGPPRTIRSSSSCRRSRRRRLGRAFVPALRRSIRTMLTSVKVSTMEVAARAAATRGRLQGDVRPADQPDQREMQQQQFHRSGARPAHGRIPLRHRADLREAQQSACASSARDGDVGAKPAQPSGRKPALRTKEHETRFRTLQAIARQYRAHPERFGVVNIWRPKDIYSITLVAGGETIRVRHPQAAPEPHCAIAGGSDDRIRVAKIAMVARHRAVCERRRVRKHHRLRHQLRLRAARAVDGHDLRALDDPLSRDHEPGAAPPGLCGDHRDRGAHGRAVLDRRLSRCLRRCAPTRPRSTVPRPSPSPACRWGSCSGRSAS